MDTGAFSCKKPLITALKEAGFCIERIKKHGEKTVITIFRHEQPFKNKDIANTKCMVKTWQIGGNQDE
jgi:hypothetical protein